MTDASDDTIEHLHRALDDIEEWMQDNGASALVDNLNPGASDDAIRAAAAKLGAPLPLALQELYKRHDGQRDEGNCFFENMHFLPLRRALEDRPGMLVAHFGLRGGSIDRDEICCAEGSALREEELSDRWFPFANTEHDYLMVNLDSGRVFRATSDTPALHVAAADLPTFLGSYASRLWDGCYHLAGDPTLEGVVEEGHIWLKRYLVEA